MEEKVRHRFALENGVRTFGTGFFVYGFLTGVVVVNDVEDGVDNADVDFLYRFSGVIVCSVFG